MICKKIIKPFCPRICGSKSDMPHNSGIKYLFTFGNENSQICVQNAKSSHKSLN